MNDSRPDTTNADPTTDRLPPQHQDAGTRAAWAESLVNDRVQERLGQFNLHDLNIDGIQMANRRMNRIFKRHRFAMEGGATNATACAERSIIASSKQTLDFIECRWSIQNQFKVIGMRSQIRSTFVGTTINSTPQITSMIDALQRFKQLPQAIVVIWAQKNRTRQRIVLADVLARCGITV